MPEIEDLFQRQAREMDLKKREALLHQIQQILHDRVMHVPIYELAFIWGVGPRVEEAARQPHQGLLLLGALRGSEAQAFALSRLVPAERRSSHARTTRTVMPASAALPQVRGS